MTRNQSNCRTVSIHSPIRIEASRLIKVYTLSPLAAAAFGPCPKNPTLANKFAVELCNLGHCLHPDSIGITQGLQ